MTKVWSGKLDCTFHGKMHWELNKEMWFLSTAANKHYDMWKQMGVKITRTVKRNGPAPTKAKVHAPAGYDTDLASIPRVGWMVVPGMWREPLSSMMFCMVLSVKHLHKRSGMSK